MRGSYRGDAPLGGLTSSGWRWGSALAYGAILAVLVGGVYLGATGLSGAASHQDPPHDLAAHLVTGEPESRAPEMMDKSQVQSLLSPKAFVNLKQQSFESTVNGRTLRVETSLEMPLQRYMMDQLKTSTSRHIGIVAMEPASGRVLAMVSFDKGDASNNTCTDNMFPAASVFKIVTAAAAIEKYQFDPDTPLTYNGRKYTLYRSQLKENRTKWTHEISLKDSFAQSVNPVFGKIGALYLGKPVIDEYAHAFGFNSRFDFELPLPPSSMETSDEPYRLAEIASGYNRTTRISPIHGAMMASTVMNKGFLVEPTVIDRITDQDGKVLYQGNSTAIRQTVRPEATEALARLMAETIRSGTCKKIFRGYAEDKVLSRLNIGGKTGSINNESQDTRYDWFVGYAEEKTGSKQIALSIVVGHEEYIGIRAARYARMAMKEFFRNEFARAKSPPKEG